MSTVKLIDNTKNELFAAAIARVSRGIEPAPISEAYYVEDDWRLLRALYKMKHMTPFEFLRVTFHVVTPIFVARQLMRYRCATYLERSLRYNVPFSTFDEGDDALSKWYESSLDAYNDAREDGMNKEDARGYLPLCTPTEFVMTTNMREMFHIFDERLSSHAQHQTRDVVEQMFELCRSVFPTCISMWEEEQ